MNYQKYPTPTETRSWDTAERETYRDFLTLERRAEKLDPSEEEMRAINRTAVTLTFASNASYRPVRFLHRVYGEENNEPLSRPYSVRLTAGLKFAYAIYRELEDYIESEVLDERYYSCPCCGRERSVALLGALPWWRHGTLEPEGSYLVALQPECGCQLDTDDVANIEREVAQEQLFATGV